MVKRPLGQTGIAVTPIAYGAFKIGGRQDAGVGQYEVPTGDQANALLNLALDLGVNLIDTARSYHLSEQRVGQALANRRDEYAVITKAGEVWSPADGSAHHFGAAAIEGSLRTSVDELQTNRLDVVLIHSTCDDVEVLTNHGVCTTLETLRSRSGPIEIGAVGFSGYTPAAFELAMQWADVLMVEYNLNRRALEPVITRACDRGIGVVVKKVFDQGRLRSRADEALRFALEHPGVTSVAIDTTNSDRLRHAVCIAEQMLPVR